MIIRKNVHLYILTNKTSNVLVTLRRVLATIVAAEKQ